MRLHQLIRAAGLPAVQVSDREITGISADSRQVQSGMIFVAISGFSRDGHQFVPEAISRGAAAIVVERNVSVPDGITPIVTSNSREALARLSSAFFGHPSSQLSVIGITGTNGKGTTAYLIEAILSHAGRPCGIIGTMGAKIGDRTLDLERTTPEAPELQRLLSEMVRGRMRYVAVEVASHALALHRVTGTQFAAAVFTNLTQDHLDFHKTFDEYRVTKRRLFEMVEPAGVSVVNADDPSGAAMGAASRAQVVTYGIRAAADVRASDVRLHLSGAEFRVETPRGAATVRSRLHGRFNVYNSLAAIAVAQWSGLSLDEIVPTLGSFPGVPGRFESVDEGQPFGVVVDYAHTPDGLQNVLETAKDFVRGRTIIVFGCGGDRDRTKRPIMGRLAAQLADIAIVTSDNPRTEEPEAILEEIMAGVRGQGSGVRVEVEPDRREAIRRAIELAGPGDMVIIAGKGHEPYQEIKGAKYPFDDRVVARGALKQLQTPR
jgi:UDP-N-acetylmuramoyl-L-alanyl-D-glutamate--2,6-diaminopimelate ligase